MGGQCGTSVGNESEAEEEEEEQGGAEPGGRQRCRAWCMEHGVLSSGRRGRRVRRWQDFTLLLIFIIKYIYSSFTNSYFSHFIVTEL
jgi:hypothetical protein